MIYIETGSYTPAVNLAYEEYFLKVRELENDLFMLWRNEPAVVVGHFQNIQEEVNSGFAQAHHIHIIRRISGGGAVYQDLGNLCFSFVLHDVRPKVFDKSSYVRPLVEALAQLGIHADVTARNDLRIDGKKFSGNAMALHKDRLLFHGTLLFETELDVLEDVLSGPQSGIVSKAVKSLRSSVTNLKEHLPETMDIVQFKKRLKDLLSANTSAVEYILSREDLYSIQKLAKTKYESWDWNFGNNPGSIIHRSRQLIDGVLEIDLQLDKGCIRACHTMSSSNMLPNLGDIEERLVGVRYTFADVLGALTSTGIDEMSDLISTEDLVQWIMI